MPALLEKEDAEAGVVVVEADDIKEERTRGREAREQEEGGGGARLSDFLEGGRGGVEKTKWAARRRKERARE